VERVKLHIWRFRSKGLFANRTRSAYLGKFPVPAETVAETFDHRSMAWFFACRATAQYSKT
jgi:hypothetical protein